MPTGDHQTIQKRPSSFSIPATHPDLVSRSAEWGADRSVHPCSLRERTFLSRAAPASLVSRTSSSFAAASSSTNTVFLRLSHGSSLEPSFLDKPRTVAFPSRALEVCAEPTISERAKSWHMTIATRRRRMGSGGVRITLWILTWQSLHWRIARNIVRDPGS